MAAAKTRQEGEKEVEITDVMRVHSCADCEKRKETRLAALKKLVKTITRDRVKYEYDADSCWSAENCFFLILAAGSFDELTDLGAEYLGIKKVPFAICGFCKELLRATAVELNISL